MTRLACTLACLALLAVASPVRADDELPWEKGVSKEDRDAANAVFSEGNALFTQLQHQPALERYRQALKHWDHPMIRFNLAVTLIRLDRILEAAPELEAALRFGEAPFPKELYQQALDYQNLVRRQLGNIEITVGQPGTQVLLDGKPWFTGPGTKSVRVESGEHSVVVEKKEFLTISRRVAVSGGKTVKDTLVLVPLDRAVILDYRHPRWLPWTVTGVGAATALAGLAFWLVGRNHLDEFQSDFINECPRGCETGLGMHTALADAQDRALLEGKIGVSLMITGGAVAVAGTIWGLLNRPTRRLPKVEVTPTPGGAAALAQWSF